MSAVLPQPRVPPLRVGEATRAPGYRQRPACRLLHRDAATAAPLPAPPTHLRLDFGSKPIERQLILSAQFLHNELPVRLAHRVAELENLPYGLSARPHVLKVRRHPCPCHVFVANVGTLTVALYMSSAGCAQLHAHHRIRRPHCDPCHAPARALPSPAGPAVPARLAVLLTVPLHFKTQVRDWYVESFKDLRSFPKVKDATDEAQFTRLLAHIYRRHKNVVPVMAMGVAGAAAKSRLRDTGAAADVHPCL